MLILKILNRLFSTLLATLYLGNGARLDQCHNVNHIRVYQLSICAEDDDLERQNVYAVTSNKK